jgi:hypothetical protein
MSPLQPWYYILRHLYPPLWRQDRGLTILTQPQTPFPFLRLPLKLRNRIYLYVSHANNTHIIEIASQWRAEKPTQRFCSHISSTTILAEHDAYPVRAPHARSRLMPRRTP